MALSLTLNASIVTTLIISFYELFEEVQTSFLYHSIYKVLPAGWIERKDPTGRIFYENTATSQIQWNFPTAKPVPHPPSKPPPSSQPQGVPPSKPLPPPTPPPNAQGAPVSKVEKRITRQLTC